MSRLTVLEHAEWVEQVRTAAEAFLAFWGTYDLLVTPTAGIVAPPVSWAPWDQDPEAHMATFMDFPNFAQPFNLSGQPALSLPLVWSDFGLPIGVHLAGRRLDDALLLRRRPPTRSRHAVVRAPARRIRLTGRTIEPLDAFELAATLCFTL